MAEPMFINELIQKVKSGQIKIPSFQRGFVWDADRIAHLMDSLYKGFPFGSLLFWRTKTPLKTEKKLGPYILPTGDPDYPIDYILDGQQRATSIFGVFQTTLLPEKGEDDSKFKIYFDLTSETTIQDSNFIFVPDAEYDKSKHFPLRLLFNPPEYRKHLKDIPEETAEKIDIIYQKFTTAKIPVQTFETDDRAAVAIVFERINRMGVELDTLQLLSAWTWSDDFDLQEEFSELSEELAPFGFKGVGDDSDLLLRCCSAIIKADASPGTIIELKGEEVRSRFEEIKKGILGAVDFLRVNFNVYSSSVLPFAQIIIPLSVFFATNNEQDHHPDAEQLIVLKQWIWRTFFTRRYSKRLEQLNEDIRSINSLKQKSLTKLGQFTIDFDERYFLESQFNISSVNTKTFILMLADQQPLSFISGAPVSLEPVLRDANKKEFHHIYPRKFLTDSGFSLDEANKLINYAIISRSENNKLSGNSPSEYRSKMPQKAEVMDLVLKSAICPKSIFDDDYKKFIGERVNMLMEKARSLMN